VLFPVIVWLKRSLCWYSLPLRQRYSSNLCSNLHSSAWVNFTLVYGKITDKLLISHPVFKDPSIFSNFYNLQSLSSSQQPNKHIALFSSTSPISAGYNAPSHLSFAADSSWTALPLSDDVEVLLTNKLSHLLWTIAHAECLYGGSWEVIQTMNAVVIRQKQTMLLYKIALLNILWK